MSGSTSSERRWSTSGQGHTRLSTVVLCEMEWNRQHGGWRWELIEEAVGGDVGSALLSIDAIVSCCSMVEDSAHLVTVRWVMSELALRARRCFSTCARPSYRRFLAMNVSWLVLLVSASPSEELRRRWHSFAPLEFDPGRVMSRSDMLRPAPCDEGVSGSLLSGKLIARSLGPKARYSARIESTYILGVSAGR